MPKRFLWLLVMMLSASQAVLAAQNCKYNSIPATAPASRLSDNLDNSVTDLQWKR